jgi:hypothetical protein
MARRLVAIAPQPRQRRHAQDEPSPRPKHAPDLFQQSIVVGVLEHIEHEHDVEGLVGYRQVGCEGLDHVCLRPRAPQLTQPFRPCVHTDHPMAEVRQLAHRVARAATHVQDSAATSHVPTPQPAQHGLPAREPEVPVLQLGNASQTVFAEGYHRCRQPGWDGPAGPCTDSDPRWEPCPSSGARVKQK